MTDVETQSVLDLLPACSCGGRPVENRWHNDDSGEAAYMVFLDCSAYIQPTPDGVICGRGVSSSWAPSFAQALDDAAQMWKDVQAAEAARRAKP